MRRRITVTKEDIENGSYFIASSCPIALAARRKFGKVNHISVGIDDIRLGGKNHELPKDAIGFIDRFDTGRRVKPFSFWITI